MWSALLGRGRLLQSRYRMARNTWLIFTSALTMQGAQSRPALGLKHLTPPLSHPERRERLKLACERTFLILWKLKGRWNLTLAVVPVQRVSPLRLRK